ncbi:hypothetical protein U1Q18_045919 [Sarracenia purpurea var. burkii]
MGVKNVSVMNEIADNNVLECSVIVSTERIAMDICFRNKFRDSSRTFFKLIIYGALSPNDIERLVIYNAFIGQEISVRMPPKDAIIKFIQKYNRYDFSQTVPAEKFITFELERYYQGDVANWKYFDIHF